jgi:hypothetical protein
MILGGETTPTLSAGFELTHRASNFVVCYEQAQNGRKDADDLCEMCSLREKRHANSFDFETPGKASGAMSRVPQTRGDVSIEVI